MNYSEFFQQAVIAATPATITANKYIDDAAESAAQYAEALAAELVKRGHLQPPVKRVEVQAEPKPLPEAAESWRNAECATCVHFDAENGGWCTKFPTSFRMSPDGSCEHHKLYSVLYSPKWSTGRG